MTELKCPICQSNLHKINIIVSTCTNDKCKLWGASIPNLVLEAWADAKKKLDIFQEFITKLYLNGNITDEQLHWLKQRKDKE